MEYMLELGMEANYRVYAHRFRDAKEHELTNIIQELSAFRDEAAAMQTLKHLYDLGADPNMTAFNENGMRVSNFGFYADCFHQRIQPPFDTETSSWEFYGMLLSAAYGGTEDDRTDFTMLNGYTREDLKNYTAYWFEVSPDSPEIYVIRISDRERIAKF